jgi:adenylate kinase family enzyme
VERVAVIGCGGSGKTSFSNLLGERLDLPVLHIDGFYWQRAAGTRGVEASPEEWAIIHRSLIERPRWVIDGMKLGTLAERLAVADTVVFLDLPTHACVWGVLSRRLRRRRSVQPDLGTYEVGVSREFVRWICNFRRVHRPKVLRLLADCSCEVIVLRSRKDTKRFLSTSFAVTQARAA